MILTQVLNLELVDAHDSKPACQALVVQRQAGLPAKLWPSATAGRSCMFGCVGLPAGKGRFDSHLWYSHIMK